MGFPPCCQMEDPVRKITGKRLELLIVYWGVGIFFFFFLILNPLLGFEGFPILGQNQICLRV